MLVVGTFCLTAVLILAAIIAIYREEIMEEPFGQIAGAAIFTLLLTIPALFVTIPIAAWISGEWAWPLAHWPIWLQVGVLVPPIMFIVGGALATLPNEDYIRLTEVGSEIAGLGFLFLITITPTVGLATFIFSAPLPLQIVVGIVWAPYLLMMPLGETMMFAAFVWLGVSIGLIVFIALVLISPWFLLLVPVILIVLLLMSDAGGGGGGGYDGGPMISWTIFS